MQSLTYTHTATLLMRHQIETACNQDILHCMQRLGQCSTPPRVGSG